jgi:hypothetical protein
VTCASVLIVSTVTAVFRSFYKIDYINLKIFTKTGVFGLNVTGVST